MTFDIALKIAKLGNMVIGHLDGFGDHDVIMHYFHGTYYTHYGMEIKKDNAHLEKMNWDVLWSSDQIAHPCIKFLHIYENFNESKNSLNFALCNKEGLKESYSKECFDSSVNKQLFIARTSSESYMLNIIRLLTLVEEAVKSNVYDHIYVFVKDELLYKDVARTEHFSDEVFSVSDQSNITFIFVKEGANCLGFLGGVFTIKEGSRILRIYDQRVMEGLTEHDIMSHYYMAQQDRDDVVIFTTLDSEKERRVYDYGTYWVDLSSKVFLPTSFYHITVLNLMDTIMNNVKHDIHGPYRTDVYHSDLSTI